MAIKEWFAEQLLSTGVVQSAMAEAWRSGYESGNDEPPPGPFKSHGYRAERRRKRDLEAVTQEDAMDLCYRLWQRHPTAKRIIEIGKDFVVGDGFALDCRHPDVQAACEEFWNDSINAMDLKLPAKVRELALFGEQLYEVFVNNGNGAVKLGAIDPTEIDAVVCDKENVEHHIGILLKGKHGQRGRLLRIVSPDDEDGMAEECVGVPVREAVRTDQYGVRHLTVEADDAMRSDWDGMCMYFAVNGMTTGTRGRPDLLPLTDWLDLLDQTLFDLTERAGLLSAFVYHVTMKGAKASEVLAKAKELETRPPRKGSVQVTNDQEEWQAVTPNLGAQDMEQFSRVLRVFIAGGAGYPEAWFGEGSNSNRATLQGQNVPTLKSLAARQRYVVYMIERILRYVVKQKVEHGRLAEELPVLDDDGNPTGDMMRAVDAIAIAVPELDTKDSQQIATTLQQVATSVIGLLNSGLVTQKVAVRTLTVVLQQLGVEVDVDAMLQELQDDEQDYNNYDALVKRIEQKERELADQAQGRDRGQVADGRPEAANAETGA